jgi:hypothetical protein
LLPKFPLKWGEGGGSRKGRLVGTNPSLLQRIWRGVERRGGKGGGLSICWTDTRESHWFRLVKTTGKRTAMGLRIIP